MTQFVHPSKKDITLTGVLGALADNTRIMIIYKMMAEEGCISCVGASPCPDIAKSTLSNHFRILREAGLIRTTKKGVENQNTLRGEEIEERFPGLLKLIMKLAAKECTSR